MELNSLQETNELKDFFEAFSKKEASILKNRLKQEKAELTGLLQGLNSLNIMRQLACKEYAPNYNLFELLGIKHFEVKTHTPFLTNLLQPYGSHDQGDVFIRSFIEQIEAFPQKQAEINYQNIEVNAEVSSIYGRVDILIQHRSIDFPFAIIIENKIWAKDQEDQLGRYYEYARSILGLADEQILIYYLTPHQKAPRIPFAMNEILYNRLTAEKKLITIGYKSHVIPWLEGILEEVRAIPVHQMIKQYIAILKKL
jgi:hypothetical protein